MGGVVDIVLFHPEKGEEKKRVPLPATGGREDQSAIFLPDKKVSRRHFLLALEGETLFLQDLGSSNGTFFKGERIEKIPLRPGDRFSAGDWEILIDRLIFLPEKEGTPEKPSFGEEIAERIRKRIREEGGEMEGFQEKCTGWVEEELTSLPLTDEEKEAIRKEVYADLFGYGPIEPLLQDGEVDEIMVNGPDDVYIEKFGKLSRTSIRFRSNDHVLKVIERIVLPLGRRIDESSPMVDARLPDGSRVNAIIPPLALNGPVLTIRKFKKYRLTIGDLIRLGSLTEEMVELLKTAVLLRKNIVVSGGTGSGKTTLLNLLSSFIPEEERIITIEDAAELQLRQPHWVRLETRPPNAEGKGEVKIRDLLRNALRMRPDRIVVGECRGGEALDMLQAMNTGHDGSLTTVHANSPRDAISRIETMCLMADVGLPHRAIREQIVRAIHLIVQQARFHDGKRRISEITEIVGLEGETPVLHTLFRFNPQTGRHENTGFRPRFLQEEEWVHS